MADADSRAGKRYAGEAITEYADRVHADHDAGLSRAFDAPSANGMPAIQIGMSEGKFLEVLVRLGNVRRAVEVGTLAGYSAIRIARALPEGGKLWSVEHDERHAHIARDNIAAAGLEGKAEVVIGAAVDRLPTLVAHGPFDLVFLDADKESYDVYGRWAAANLRPGGLLVADNAYLFGNLLEDESSARAMRAFHEETARVFQSVCVPTPDGMVVGVAPG